MSAVVTMPAQTVLHPRLVVSVAGTPVSAFSFDAQHGVNQPVGTGSVTFPLPLPTSLMASDEALLNQRIEVQAGHDETAIRTVFSGRIDADRMEVDEREGTVTLQMRGWAALLEWEEEADLEFAGPIRLDEIIRSLCRWRGVPMTRIDPIVDHRNGLPIMLGGQIAQDEGSVIIPRRTSPLTWMTRMCRLFGYRLFDAPSGEIRVQRVSGMPVGPAVATYADAGNTFGMSRSRDLAGMATYWTVEGATVTDLDGVRMTVMSRPASVPYNPLLNPPGYRADRLSDRELVNHTLADAAREIAEIDHGAPTRSLRWEAVGDAWRSPGDVVRVRSHRIGEDGLSWLMSTRQRMEGPEYLVTCDAWRGGGTALSEMSDLQTVPLGAGPWHVGDEYVAWYQRPTPQGLFVPIPFTVPEEHTSVAVSGFVQGANSQIVNGTNTELKVSKIEFWQAGESVGSADLPVVPERTVQPFRVPLPNGIEAGNAELRPTSGSADFGNDDFELTSLVIELRGAGRPTLPVPRGW